MKSQALISVITVSRNRKFFIQQLIQSLINQNFKKYELIIIENASETETKEYIKSLDIDNIEVKKYFLEEEKTISACRNIPFKNNLIATSVKYIYFIDDDDLIFKNTLTNLYNCIHTEKADFIFGTTFKIFSNGNLLNNILTKINYPSLLINFLRNTWVIHIGRFLFPSKQWLLIRHCILLGIHSILLDRRIVELNYFDECIDYGEDSLFWYQITPLIRKYKSIPFVIVPYRRHGNNTFDQHNYANKKKCLINTFEFYEDNKYSEEEKYIVLYVKYMEERFKQFQNFLNKQPYDDTFNLTYQKLSAAIDYKLKVKAAFFFFFPALVRYFKMGVILLIFFYKKTFNRSELLEINSPKNIRV